MLLCERKSKTKGSNATWREKLAAKSGLAVMLAEHDRVHPRRGHSGGDTRAAHDAHVAALRALLKKMRKRKEKLPAQTRHPKEPDYAKIADRIGARVESFRIGSELRRMVDRAASKLEVAPSIREDGGEILLTQVLEAAVTALRRERQIEGAPAQDEVNALKRTAWLAARTLRGDLSLPAARALESLRTCVDEDKMRLSRPDAGALGRLEACYRELLEGDGLPEGFAEALSALNARTGLSLSLAAKMVGMHPQTLANYAAGRKVPDKSKWHFVTALEQLYRVDVGELTGRIRSNRKGRARFAQKLYPPHLRGIEHVRRRWRISPLLPADLETLSEVDRYSAIARAEAQVDDEDAASRKRGSLLVKEQRYGLTELPKAFEADFTAMAAFRESIAGTGMITGKRWTRKTSDIWHNRMLAFGGFIVSEHAGGLRIAPKRLDFRVFMDPTNVDAFIGFRLDRAKSAGKSDKPSDIDIEHLSFAGALFGKAGWLRQSPDFAGRVGMSASKWSEKCKELQERYRELASDRRKNRRKPAHERTGSRDDGYGGALPVLKLKRPMEAPRRLVASMQAEFDVMSDQSSKKAGTSQDLVWTQLQAQLALRPFTWSLFEYRPDNRGHLRRDAQGWYVDIPRDCFKNRESRALEGGFVHRLRDVGGLYANLETHLAVHRFAIVRGMKTNLLFVYGRKGLNADGTPAPSRRKNYRPYEAGLACAVRRFVARHIGFEADPATRIEGLRTFSPCAFRHILATAIVKATGRCDLAADAIGDTPEVAQRYYQRFLPEDRKEELESARTDLFSEVDLESEDAAPPLAETRRSAERRVGARYRAGNARPAVEHRATGPAGTRKSRRSA
jgi:hypothetical protein